MPVLLLILALLLMHSVSVAQPLVDFIQLRYTNGFPKKNDEATSHEHLWIGCELPPPIATGTRLIFSPAYEHWKIDSSGTSFFPVVRSFSFPMGILDTIGQSNWSITIMGIPRWNGEKLFNERSFQFGAAALVAYGSPRFTGKLGIYINREFFGTYFVPLIGIDWRITETNYIFGNLPGRLTFEHQLNKHFYYGFTFRAITNSYRLKNGDFLRIDDHQTSLFLDYYVTENICITLEPGYGLCRKLRTGEINNEYKRKAEWQNGPFIKLNASYRKRTD